MRIVLLLSLVFIPALSIAQTAPPAAIGHVRKAIDTQGEIHVVGGDRRVALVADATCIGRKRRLQVELLAVVVHGHVARELEPLRAPVDGPLAGAPAERPRGRGDPHVLAGRIDTDAERYSAWRRLPSGPGGAGRADTR